LIAILDDQASGQSVAEIAGRFHCTLALLIEEMCSEISKKTSLRRVVFSGGVFQNCLLTQLAVARLARAGFDVLTHSLVPPNDGGLALGQAAIACRR